MTTTRRRDTARPVSEATGKAAPIVTGLRTATGKRWHAKLAANAWRTARLGAEADVCRRLARNNPPASPKVSEPTPGSDVVQPPARPRRMCAPRSRTGRNAHRFCPFRYP